MSRLDDPRREARAATFAMGFFLGAFVWRVATGEGIQIMLLLGVVVSYRLWLRCVQVTVISGTVGRLLARIVNRSDPPDRGAPTS